jgi:diadenosine tetraphosphate (Ap4A) HIT family hydrolase
MDELQVLADFRSKFRVDELLVAHNEAWSWSVRPGQVTLAAGIVSLNRHAARFAEVTAPEMAALAEIVGSLEHALRSAFDYQAINYLMLMMVDHHVHFHVIPRYAGPRSFAGVQWVDRGWPTAPVLAEAQHADRPELPALLQQQLQAALPPADR